MIIHKVVFYILIFKLIMTLYQRKFNNNGGYKRVLSLYQSLFVGAIYIVISILNYKNFPIITLYITLIISVVLGILLRKKIFPYSSSCKMCDKRATFYQILFIDEQKCPSCLNKD